MKESRPSFSGGSALLATAFIYGLFSILFRAMDKMFSVTAQTTVRTALVLAVLFGFNWFTHRLQKIPRPALYRLILLGIVITGLLLLFTYAVTNTKISTTISVQYAGIIATSFLLGGLLFKEKLTFAKVIALLLAGCGLAMYAGTGLALNLAILAAFASGIFDAIANALRKSLGAYNLSRTLLLQYQYMVALVCMAAITIVAGGDLVKDVSLTAILATIIFVGLLIVSGNLLFYGFKHFDVNAGAIILASEIFFAAVLAYLFFDEVPTAGEATGACLIFAAAILSTVNVKFGRSKKEIP